MNWHPWNTHRQFDKNYQGRRKSQPSLTSRPSGKKQQSKCTKKSLLKKRYGTVRPGQRKEKKVQNRPKLKKRPGKKCRLNFKSKKTVKVKQKTCCLLENSRPTPLDPGMASVSVEPLGVYAPLSLSDESDIEVMEILKTNLTVQAPLIDLTVEGDPTEDVLLVSCSSLDDSVTLLKNVGVKSSLQRKVEDTTSILPHGSGKIPVLQKAVCKGVKRHRSFSFSRDPITGKLLRKASPWLKNVLGIDTALQDSHQSTTKKKTTFTEYSSPLISLPRLADKKKGTLWEATSKQLQCTVENDLVVQPHDLVSSAIPLNARLYKTGTDNSVGPCSKENMRPGNRLQRSVKNTSTFQPNQVDVHEAITENVPEISSEVVDLRDVLSEMDSIKSLVSDFPDSQILSFPAEDVLGNTIAMGSSGALSVPRRLKNCHNKNTGKLSKSTRPMPTTGRATFLPRIEDSNNIQNLIQLASFNEAQRSAMTNPALFNSVPNVAQFSSFSEAQNRIMALQQILSGGSVHSSIPWNFEYSLRPIVIDGSNIARSHGSTTGVFSCRGIAISIEHFLTRGHAQVTALVPQFRRNLTPQNPPVTDQWILEKLANQQLVAFTPSRTLRGKTIASYDDRFIVDLASRNGGVIVSNDNFRDVAREKFTWKQTVEQRLLMYVFVGDIFMIPEDPFGRNGVRLKDFLSFPRS